MPDDPTPTTDPEPTTDDPTPTDEPKAGDPSALGDPGKKALDAERAARREAERSAKELQQKLQEIEDAEKSEMQKAQEAAEAAAKRADTAERRLMLMEVASEKGLTPAQAKRLSGETREELAADADEFLSMLTPKKTPPPGGRPTPADLHSGNGDEGDSFDAEALADKIAKRSYA